MHAACSHRLHDCVHHKPIRNTVKLCSILERSSSNGLLMRTFSLTYIMSQKISARVFVTTSPNTEQFSKFFRRHTLRKICNTVTVKDSITTQTRRYILPCEMLMSNLGVYRILTSHFWPDQCPYEMLDLARSGNGPDPETQLLGFALPYLQCWVVTCYM